MGCCGCGLDRGGSPGRLLEARRARLSLHSAFPLSISSWERLSFPVSPSPTIAPSLAGDPPTRNSASTVAPLLKPSHHQLRLIFPHSAHHLAPPFTKGIPKFFAFRHSVVARHGRRDPAHVVGENPTYIARSSACLFFVSSPHRSFYDVAVGGVYCSLKQALAAACSRHRPPRVWSVCEQ